VTIVGIARQRAERQPDDEAFTFLARGSAGEEYLTYAGLDRRARAIAARLQATCAIGDRVLVCHPPGLDYVAAFFGCLYAGVIAVPAYPPSSASARRRLEAVTLDARPRVMLGALPFVADSASPEIAALPVLAPGAIDGGEAAEWKPIALHDDTIAFLQYTSGSTGRPRGVMVGHGNLVHNLALIRDAFGHTAESRGVIWLPPYHDMGLIGGVLQPLFAGFPVVLMSPSTFLQRPTRWLEAITRWRATTSGGPNFAYDVCVERIPPAERERLDLRTWTTAFNGAEPVRPATLDRFAEAFASSGFRRRAFYPCYGLAEATLMVSGRYADDSPEPDGVSCGKAGAGQQIVVVDPETRSALPEGVEGEIWVAGPSVAHGYWGQPAQTEDTFRARLASGDEGPFLRTGDLGILRAGELHVTGRIKDVIVVDGLKHHAEDLEWTAAGSHPALSGVVGAAFAIETSGGEGVAVAHEVRARTSDEILDDVIACIRRAVTARHGVPVHALALVPTGALPRTTSGKVRRSACRELFATARLPALREWRSS
jgi:acyl-CoA synthetase (AMP-forming)/AMP-acid ligase II